MFQIQDERAVATSEKDKASRIGVDRDGHWRAPRVQGIHLVPSNLAPLWAPIPPQPHQFLPCAQNAAEWDIGSLPFASAAVEAEIVSALCGGQHRSIEHRDNYWQSMSIYLPFTVTECCRPSEWSQRPSAFVFSAQSKGRSVYVRTLLLSKGRPYSRSVVA